MLHSCEGYFEQAVVAVRLTYSQAWASEGDEIPHTIEVEWPVPFLGKGIDDLWWKCPCILLAGTDMLRYEKARAHTHQQILDSMQVYVTGERHCVVKRA